MALEDPVERRPDCPPSIRLAMLVQFGAAGAVFPFISLILLDRGLALPEVSRLLFWASASLLVFPLLWGWLADRFLSLERVFLLLNLGGAGFLIWFLRQETFGGLAGSYVAYFALVEPTLVLMNALAYRHLAHPENQFGGLRAWGSAGWIVPSLPIE